MYYTIPFKWHKNKNRDVVPATTSNSNKAYDDGEEASGTLTMAEIEWENNGDIGSK